MIFVIFVNLVIIIVLYMLFFVKKLGNTEKIDLKEFDAPILGYLDNSNGNIYDWLLAEILEMVRKKYIEIEYIRKDVDKYDYIFKKSKNIDLKDLKTYEINVYRILFYKKDTISMDELEEYVKLNDSKKNDINIKLIVFKNRIEEALIDLDIVSMQKKKQIKVIKRLMIIMALISIMIAYYIEEEIIFSIIAFIEIVIIYIMIMRCDYYTEFGKELKERVKEYKNYLEDNELIGEKNISHQVLYEKAYIDAIAFHINKIAKDEFIYDEMKYITKEKRKEWINWIFLILYWVIIWILC